MARSVGRRSIGRKTPTITRAELQEFKDSGRKVSEKGGRTLLDGFRPVKVVDGDNQPVAEEQIDDQQPVAKNRFVDGDGGSETGLEDTGFASTKELQPGNPLFDQPKFSGSNELTDFEGGGPPLKGGRNT